MPQFQIHWKEEPVGLARFLVSIPSGSDAHLVEKPDSGEEIHEPRSYSYLYY